MKSLFGQLKGLLGLRTLWLYLYLFKAALAFLLTMPLFVVADSALSSSLFGRSLIESWDVSVFVELISLRGEAFAPLLMTVIIGAILFAVMIQFINGGLYYTVVSRKFTVLKWREFFAECGVNFGTHVRITLIMLIIYALLLPSGMFFISIISFAGAHIMGTPALIFTMIKLLFMMLIFTVASIFSDSARAASAAFPEKGLREILRVASEFFKPRLLSLMKIYIITYLPFFIIWLLVEWLALKATGGLGGLAGIAIEFILFQAAAVSRTGQKLWYLIYLGREFHSVYPGRFIPEQTELNFDDR